MTAAYVIMALCVLVGVPFTLWWWREADKWADKEHQRFTHKPDESLKNAVVVKWDAHTPSPGNPAATEQPLGSSAQSPAPAPATTVAGKN